MTRPNSEMSQLAFVSTPLDRGGNRRNDPDFAAKMPRDGRAKHVHVRGDLVRMDGPNLFLGKSENEGEFIYLGCDGNDAHWIAHHAAVEDETFRPLRSLMLEGQLPPEQLSILAQARSLVHWHETHGFCAKCGQKTLMRDMGYRRHCEGCGADHFPRTDPVVIMVVRHGNNLLLGRQASWPPGMVSALAGFMEPGETIEDAVRREVREEAGIDVDGVRYLMSQPWPFPASLMIGCVGDAKSDAIVVDGNELEMARWFTRDEVKKMLEGNHPEGLKASNPYAIAHHIVRAAVQEMEAGLR